MEIIPQTGMNKDIAEANKIFSASQSEVVTMFVESDTFSSAKEIAEKFATTLEETGLFQSIELENSTIDMQEIRDYVTDNVYLLLDSDTCNRISEDPSSFQQDSLATIFSGFTLSSVNSLSKDPFMLGEQVWLSLLGKISQTTSMYIKDGVLTIEHEGKHYVMISGIPTQKAVNVALSSKSNSLNNVFAIGDSFETDNVKIYYSGVPFHTCESAGKSHNEITIIAGLSMVFLFLMFLMICKNVRIIKSLLICLVLSVTTAVSALLIFFKSFHIMTLIFGTSLIGISVDYSIHYYVRYTRKKIDNTGIDVRDKLKKTLLIGFISTFVCYFVFVFSEYSILRQISVFSCAGLLSSYLTTIYLYPKIVTEKSVNRNSLIVKHSEKSHPYLLPIFAILAVILLIVRIPSLKIKNNISDLYTPSARLLEGESKFAQLMGYSDATYAIISDSMVENLLEKESHFVSEAKKYADVLAITEFMPTVSQQKQSISSAKLLLPYLESQAEILELSQDEMLDVKNKIENLQPLTEISGFQKALDIGKINNQYYHAVVLRNATDTNQIKQIANGTDGISYFSVGSDISAQLDILTQKILMLFALGFCVIMILLIVTFGLKNALRISLVPITVIISTISFVSLFGLYIDFFFAIGLVLIIGLGLDYVVFANERHLFKKEQFDEAQSGTSIAVTLSFITTELSFGILTFSSFKPVHIFGLTVFFGILIAYICSIFGKKK